MKIYDISQEVFTCEVYPGDEAPFMREVCRMKQGDFINLTSFSMCAHNGTHVDAPFHFVDGGKTVEMIPLEKTVGLCYVAEFDGSLSAEDAVRILESAAAEDSSGEAARRILLKGEAEVTPSAAEAFADAGIFLIGVESQSVGEAGKPAAVHELLLGREVVLLEGVRLSSVKEGKYLLNAAPIALGGSDGAPCRAILIEAEER